MNDTEHVVRLGHIPANNTFDKKQPFLILGKIIGRMVANLLDGQASENRTQTSKKVHMRLGLHDSLN